MDQRQEMMDDAIDDATGMEDEEESEDVVNQVLDEIGIDLGQMVRIFAVPSSNSTLTLYSLVRRRRGCKRMPFLRGEWRRLWELEALIPTTMIFKHGWIV